MARKQKSIRAGTKRGIHDPLFVRPKDATEIVGFSRSKIYALIKSGQLPIVRFGGTARISLPALKRLAEGVGD
jgi:excisionase family DNA binding protein